MLKVDTSVSTKVYRLSIFIYILAIIAFIAGFIFFLIWACDISYRSEDYLLPFVISASSGVSLLVTRAVLKALSKIAEAAEYTKAKIAEGYDTINEKS